jgi:hypothetical protein
MGTAARVSQRALGAHVDGARSTSGSGVGAFGQRPASKRRVLRGRGDERLVERADVGAGRDDFVDAVQELVGEADVEAGEQIVELLAGAGPEECAGDVRMGDGERHGHVRGSQARVLGERKEPLGGVEPALVVDRREERAPNKVGLAPPAGASGQHSLPERPPDQQAHAVALGRRKHLALARPPQCGPPGVPGRRSQGR